MFSRALAILASGRSTSTALLSTHYYGSVTSCPRTHSLSSGLPLLSKTQVQGRESYSSSRFFSAGCAYAGYQASGATSLSSSPPSSSSSKIDRSSHTSTHQDESSSHMDEVASGDKDVFGSVTNEVSDVSKSSERPKSSSIYRGGRRGRALPQLQLNDAKRIYANPESGKADSLFASKNASAAAGGGGGLDDSVKSTSDSTSRYRNASKVTSFYSGREASTLEHSTNVLDQFLQQSEENLQADPQAISKENIEVPLEIYALALEKYITARRSAEHGKKYGRKVLGEAIAGEIENLYFTKDEEMQAIEFFDSLRPFYSDSEVVASMDPILDVCMKWNAKLAFKLAAAMLQVNAAIAVPRLADPITTLVVYSAANRDHTDAKLLYALLLTSGVGVEADIPQSTKLLLQLAVEEKHPRAIFHSALRYRNGVGIEKDVVKYVALLKRGAALEDVDCLRELAILHLDGVEKDIIAKNEKLAVNLLERAATLGSTQAVGQLGACYLGGAGVEADYEKAYKLFEVAAGRGDVLALYYLGIMSYKGLYVQASPTEAVSYFSLAARYGSTKSLWHLGKFFVEGYGVTRSLSQAKRLFDLGAKLGDEDCGLESTKLSKFLDARSPSSSAAPTPTQSASTLNHTSNLQAPDSPTAAESPKATPPNASQSAATIPKPVWNIEKHHAIISNYLDTLTLEQLKQVASSRYKDEGFGNTIVQETVINPVRAEIKEYISKLSPSLWAEAVPSFASYLFSRQTSLAKKIIGERLGTDIEFMPLTEFGNKLIEISKR